MKNLLDGINGFAQKAMLEKARQANEKLAQQKENNNNNDNN